MKQSVANQIIKAYRGDFGEAVRETRRIEEAIRFEQAKKLLKDNGGKIPGHRWYKKEKYNYEAYGLLKGKVTGYFKTEAGRYGGNRRIFIYHKVHETGFMVSVNETMCKIGVNQAISTPHKFQSSNKREYDSAFKKVMKIIN